MFDSVLGHGTVPKSRFGTGAVLSVLLHIGVLALAIYLSKQKAHSEDKAVAVVLKVAAAPPPPPPPASSSHKEKKTPKKNQLVQPKEIPKEKPPEAEPDKKDEEMPSRAASKGSQGRRGGGRGGWHPGRNRDRDPRVWRGNDAAGAHLRAWRDAGPSYTSEARAAEIEGLMIVKCVIAPDGSVTNCQIIKPLPHMDAAVLQWLAGAKYHR